MKTMRLIIASLTLVVLATLLPIQSVKASPTTQMIDPCDASKLVLEVIVFLNTPDMGLAQAIELAGKDSFWVSEKIVDFDLAFGNAARNVERGVSPTLRSFFSDASREKFIGILKAAGYVRGHIRFTEVFGTPQNLWSKPNDWKDPCQPPPRQPAGQPEPNPGMDIDSPPWELITLLVLIVLLIMWGKSRVLRGSAA